MSAFSTSFHRLPGSRALARLILPVLLATAFSGTACDEIESLAPPDDAPHTDLSITTTVNPANAAIGAQVVVTLRVRNNGPIAASGVLVGDTAQSGMNYVAHAVTDGAYSSGTRRWTIPTLAEDTEATMTLTLAVASGTVGSALQFRAGVLSTEQNDSLLTNNVASVNVNVIAGTPPPPPPPPTAGVTFSSDWGSATGTALSALTDGGKWDDVYCGSASQTLSVVAGGPVGWTLTPNVLRLRQMGESTCGLLEKVNAVPASTTHWGRFYFRNDETGTTHNHVATYFPVGDIQVAIWNRAGSASGLRLFLRTYKDPSLQFAGWPYSYWELPTSLSHGVWYRYEWHMEHVTASTYRLWPRVYNMAGTLIADADDYRDSNGGRSLAAHYATGATFGVVPTLARNFGLGNEGPAGSGNTGGYWYHARVALSTAGWIGQ